MISRGAENKIIFKKKNSSEREELIEKYRKMKVVSRELLENTFFLYLSDFDKRGNTDYGDPN